MNEQAAREVMLVHAIESADSANDLLSEDDRQRASTDAKQLSQWQASQDRSQPPADAFLHQRAGQILKQLANRHPALAAFTAGGGAFHLFLAGLPVLGLLAGIFLDHVTDPHRVDLLSAPLLLIIGWNLAVYAGLLVWACFPQGWRAAPGSGWAHRLSLGPLRLPDKLPMPLSKALAAFTIEWPRLSQRLVAARLGRTMHLGAALFALGALLSLVARAYLSQYSAGWESTFLTAGQVHALLSALFAPALAVFPLQGFSVAEVEALRFGQAPVSPLGGARWVQLYAASLLLLVVLPRLLLAGASHWRVQQMRQNFPLDLAQPYFRRLLNSLGGAPGVLRVLAYSFAVDEARRQGLGRLATRWLGEQARLDLLPALAYGQALPGAVGGMALGGSDGVVTAVLFSLAATPEAENHGALLDSLSAASVRGLAVLVDESGYLERLGGQAGASGRIADRIALWQQFCSFHGAPATIVNLLDPGARPLDSGAGPALSSKA